MKEEIARWLRTHTLKEVEVENPTLENDGIVPWDKATQVTKSYWLHEADEFIFLLKEEIRKSLLTDEEIRALDYSYSGEFKNSREIDEWVKQVVAQAQVNNTLKTIDDSSQ